jgi:hypothetical protein
MEHARAAGLQLRGKRPIARSSRLRGDRRISDDYLIGALPRCEKPRCGCGEHHGGASVNEVRESRIGSPRSAPNTKIVASLQAFACLQRPSSLRYPMRLGSVTLPVLLSGCQSTRGRLGFAVEPFSKDASTVLPIFSLPEQRFSHSDKRST